MVIYRTVKNIGEQRQPHLLKYSACKTYFYEEIYCHYTHLHSRVVQTAMPCYKISFSL